MATLGAPVRVSPLIKVNNKISYISHIGLYLKFLFFIGFWQCGKRSHELFSRSRNCNFG